MKILKINTPFDGFEKAKELLYKNCDSQTVLFLSGGSTPKVLYETLENEKKLKVGAVATVDERYGEKLHENSNELMIKGTGFLNYLENQNTHFYSILESKDIETTTKDYEGVVQSLLKDYKQRIAILGIGSDGHIAGLPAGISNFQFPISNDLVINIQNFPGEFKQRITLTFKALEQMDTLIVIVLGEEKKNALELMLTSGSIEEIPARFFNKKEVTDKTILITDQKT